MVFASTIYNTHKWKPLGVVEPFSQRYIENKAIEGQHGGALLFR